MIAANDAEISPVEFPPVPSPRNPIFGNDRLHLHNGCGLALMRTLADRSIDLILADLPYSITATSIDQPIDLDAWMSEMARVISLRGSIVAFCAQPFTTDLILASRAFDRPNERFLKEDLIWQKPKATGFLQPNRHLKYHESILVFSHAAIVSAKFSKRPLTFNDQSAVSVLKAVFRRPSVEYLGRKAPDSEILDYKAQRNRAGSILRFEKERESLHPFQKPIRLLEYLIRTYSNLSDTILDPSMGSGSTGVAALNVGRRFIGAENGFDRHGQSYFELAERRIHSTL